MRPAGVRRDSNDSKSVGVGGGGRLGVRMRGGGAGESGDSGDCRILADGSFVRCIRHRWEHGRSGTRAGILVGRGADATGAADLGQRIRSEEHTSELQSQSNLVCRLLLEKKKKK